MTINLGGYPAKQCPRVVHNKYSPSAPTEPEPSRELQMLFDGGKVFETEVTDELGMVYALTDELLVLHGVDWEQNSKDTLEAMRNKVPVIVHGRLPSVDGRSGAPDVMIQWRDGYLPADIKGHQTLSKPSSGGGTSRSKVTVSPVNAPNSRTVYQGRSSKGGHWRDDVMQLAHYTRMLQALGLHAGGKGADPGTLIGAIIGTSGFDDIFGDGLGFTWYDLTVEDQETFSATEPDNRTHRSALERYDHEFAFRLKVAEAAKAGGELVRPLGVPDCQDCVWAAYCESVVPADDASFSLKAGRLNAQEWLYLYPEGGEFSIADLANLDPARGLEGFARHSVGTRNAGERLGNAIRRGEMTVAGREVEPLDGAWPEVPSADIEVDFDIEWDLGGRIYQWGVRIREDQDESTARYEPVVSFEVLDEAAEVALANRFAAKINGLAQEAERAGKTLTIFHWHHVELSRTRKFARVAQALNGRTSDLLNAWFNKHLFARQNSSIKTIAPLFGFHWSVDDPGGRFSQDQVERARAGAADAQQWCLNYNESDVAAQAAIRDGIRKLAEGSANPIR